MPAICIPLASGVPNLNGPPGFISDLAGAPFKNKLDDPRWTGALGQGFPTVPATSDAAGFRALYFEEAGVKSLYLSWHVKADTVVNTSGERDAFYIGFRPGGAGTATVFKILPFGNANANYVNVPPEDATLGGSIVTFTNTGAAGLWVQAAADPAWVNANTRVWLQRTPVDYAIQMRVPYNLFNLGNTFTMWYAMRTVLPSNVVTYHTWPSNQEPTDTINGEQFPNPNTAGNWQEYGASPTCVIGNGVGLLDYEDIGTLNTPTHHINKTSANTFYARPTNSTGAVIPAGTIKARFRIANWGSTYSDASWDDVPGLNAVTHTVNYPTGHPASNATPITGVWTLNAADLARYQGAGKTRHQCIFVTLSGAGVTFTKDSSARNMDFVPASLIEREAEINIRGLAPLSTQPRDIYILVKKGNMPQTAPANYNEGEFLSTTLKRLVQENRDDLQFVERLQAVMRQLEGGSGQAEEQSAKQLETLMSVLYAQLDRFPQKDGNDDNVASTNQLVRAIQTWLTAVKRNPTASRNLAALLRAFEEWLLASANGGENPKITTLGAALLTWLSQLPGDDASQRYLPNVIESFRTWLSNLDDPIGAVARLIDVIAAFENALKDLNLPALIKVIGLLTTWLSNLGSDEGNTQASVRGLIAEICEWLSPGKQRLGVLIEAMQQAGLTSEDYAKIFPTCVYHVFHDTGRREKRADGATIPILAAQSGFGLHAYHEGAVEGWSAIIEGATRLAEDFYVLKVPENGAARVTTKIQAREPGEKPIPEPPIVVPPIDPTDPDPKTHKGCLQMILDLLTGKK